MIGEFETKSLEFDSKNPDKKERHLIIAIAGTNDKEDMVADAATTAQVLSDWGNSNGIRVAPDCENIRSTSGFLGYAEKCYQGIMQAIKEHGIVLCDIDQIWLTGHSLGGAAVSIMLCTETFQNAIGHTFGGARPLKRFSKSPKRRLTRTVDLLDIVQWVPLSCHHLDSKQIIVTPIGSRSKMPGRYKLMLAGVLMVIWVCGLIIPILAKLKLISTDYSIASGHSMEAYCLNRESVR